MNCQEAKTLIPIFLDGELDDPDRQRLADHLRTCADCQAEAREIEETWELLGAVKAIEPDPNYSLRFWRSVDAQRPWPARVWQYVQTVSANPRWLPAAAAAAIVLLISAIVVFESLKKPQMPAALTALAEVELEMFADIELIKDFDIIKEFDFYTDFEIIESLNGPEAS
jgi:anti-sigma factor RsiW